jgi:hypothetical protein
MTSIDTYTGSLNDNITDTNKDFHEVILNTTKAIHEELAQPHVPGRGANNEGSN